MTIRKGLSLNYFTHLNMEDGVSDLRLLYHNDYRQPSVRQCAAESDVTIIKVWISWGALLAGWAPTPAWEWPTDTTPRSPLASPLDAMWDFLNESPKIGRLDRQVAAINADGKYAILSMYPDTPVWARATDSPNYFVDKPESVFADSYAPNSYWQWFVAYLFARYREGVARNLDGPNPSNGHGNPEGAWAAFVEPLNEPNFQQWPQADAVCNTATAIKTAHDASAFWAPAGFPYVLAPGTSDASASGRTNVHASDGYGTYTAVERTGYDDFTIGVLGILNGWQPTKAVFWSHHNYSDVKDCVSTAVQPRVDLVASRLTSMGWAGDPFRPRKVFLTEGGLNMPVDDGTLDVTLQIEDTQKTQVPLSMAAAAASDAVPWWTNHIVNDEHVTSDTFHSGLRRNWGSSSLGSGDPGDTRMVYDDFRDFPSDDTSSP